MVSCDPVAVQGARARTDYGAGSAAADGMSGHAANDGAGDRTGFTRCRTAAERGSCQRNGANSGSRDKATHL
jgi:hypothetical protein